MCLHRLSSFHSSTLKHLHCPSTFSIPSLIFLYLLASDFLNASTVSSDLSITLVDSKSVNKTHDITLSTTMWSGLQPLQEIVTPSPVESISESSEELLQEEITDTNETEGPKKLKEDVDVITELKDDIPSVDKFVRAGR